MSEGRDVRMPECGNSMSDGRRLAVVMGFLGVLEGLP
jgi:hypothetical protein